MPSAKRAIPLALVLGLALVAPMGAQAKPVAHPHPVAKAAQEEGEEVVLPTRVSSAIRRTQRALDNAEEHIDENEFKQSLTSLRAVRRNMFRADRAARAQLAVPPPAEESEVEAPDPSAAVLAVLSLDHTIVTTAAGLYDANSNSVVDSLTHATFRTMNARDKLLDALIATGAGGEEGEGGEGVDLADVMVDTLPDYDDEVANLTEAIAEDTLSAGSRKVLTKALAQAQATQLKVTTAFGAED